MSNIPTLLLILRWSLYSVAQDVFYIIRKTIQCVVCVFVVFKLVCCVRCSMVRLIRGVRFARNFVNFIIASALKWRSACWMGMFACLIV